MNSELLKRMAAGEAFDLVEGVREIARVLVAQALEDAPQDRVRVDEAQEATRPLALSPLATSSGVAQGKITTPRGGARKGIP